MGENWSKNRARIKENSQSLGMTLHYRIRAMPLKNTPIIYIRLRQEQNDGLYLIFLLLITHTEKSFISVNKSIEITA